jgi:hypothetical protein
VCRSGHYGTALPNFSAGELASLEAVSKPVSNESQDLCRWARNRRDAVQLSELGEEQFYRLPARRVDATLTWEYK